MQVNAAEWTLGTRFVHAHHNLTQPSNQYLLNALAIISERLPRFGDGGVRQGRELWTEPDIAALSLPTRALVTTDNRCLVYQKTIPWQRARFLVYTTSFAPACNTDPWKPLFGMQSDLRPGASRS